MWHSCKTILTWHSCKTLLTWHSCKTLLMWHSYLTLLIWHSCKTILSWHSCRHFLCRHQYNCGDTDHSHRHLLCKHQYNCDDTDHSHRHLLCKHRYNCGATDHSLRHLLCRHQFNCGNTDHSLIHLLCKHQYNCGDTDHSHRHLLCKHQYNCGDTTQLDTVSGPLQTRSPLWRALRRHRKRLRTLADTCERLRPQTQNLANTASPPDPQVKREPSLRIREKHQKKNMVSCCLWEDPVALEGFCHFRAWPPDPPGESGGVVCHAFSASNRNGAVFVLPLVSTFGVWLLTAKKRTIVLDWSLRRVFFWNDLYICPKNLPTEVLCLHLVSLKDFFSHVDCCWLTPSRPVVLGRQQLLEPGASHKLRGSTLQKPSQIHQNYKAKNLRRIQSFIQKRCFFIPSEGPQKTLFQGQHCWHQRLASGVASAIPKRFTGTLRGDR